MRQGSALGDAHKRLDLRSFTKLDRTESEVNPRPAAPALRAEATEFRCSEPPQRSIKGVSNTVYGFVPDSHKLETALTGHGMSMLSEAGTSLKRTSRERLQASHLVVHLEVNARDTCVGHEMGGGPRSAGTLPFQHASASPLKSPKDGSTSGSS